MIERQSRHLARMPSLNRKNIRVSLGDRGRKIPSDLKFAE